MKLVVEPLDARWQPSATVPDPFTLPAMVGPISPAPLVVVPTRLVDGPLVAVEPELAAGRVASVNWGDGVITPGTVTASPGLQSVVGTSRVLDAGATYHVAVTLSDGPAELVFRFDVQTVPDAALDAVVVAGYREVSGGVSLSAFTFSLADTWTPAGQPTGAATPSAPVTAPPAITPPVIGPPATVPPVVVLPAVPPVPPPPPVVAPVLPPPAAVTVSPPPAVVSVPPPPPGSPFRAGPVRASLQRPFAEAPPVVTRPVSVEVADRVGWTTPVTVQFVPATEPGGGATGGLRTRADDVGGALPSPVFASWRSVGVRRPTASAAGDVAFTPRPPSAGVSRSLAQDSRPTPGRAISAAVSLVAPDPPVLHGVPVLDAPPDPVAAVLAGYLADQVPEPVFPPAEPPAERSVWSKLVAVTAVAAGAGARAVVRGRRPDDLTPLGDWLG